MDQTGLIKEFTALTTILYRLSRSVGQCKDPQDLPSISGIQFQTMMMLNKSEVINMTELADRMLMTRQQLTKIIDALVEKGFVARGNDPNNRKHVMIQVTEAGEEFIKELMLSRHIIMSKLIDTLNEEDAQRFLGAIVVIREVLEKADFTQMK